MLVLSNQLSKTQFYEAHWMRKSHQFRHTAVAAVCFEASASRQHSLSLKSFCRRFKSRTLAHLRRNAHQNKLSWASLTLRLFCRGLACCCVKLLESWTNSSVCSSQSGRHNETCREVETLTMLWQTGGRKQTSSYSWKRRIQAMFETTSNDHRVHFSGKGYRFS